MITAQVPLSYLDFQIVTSGDSIQDHMMLSCIRNGFRKVLSLEDLLAEEFSISEPLARVLSLAKEGGVVVILIAPSYRGIEKFFYDMVVKGGVPGRRCSIDFFFYSQFFYAKEEQGYVFCEAHFSCQDMSEYESAKESFPQLEAELCFGAVSLYRGNRMLELKGQLCSEKTPFIYERIAEFSRRKAKDLDGDIFAFMQHFLVSCREEFKQNREALYLTRLICVFYLFEKDLRKKVEDSIEKRHVSFKTTTVRLQSPFGQRKALGVFVGISSFKSQEVFEESHLLKGLKEIIQEIQIVEGSQVIRANKEEKIKVLYLEIEKKSGEEFFLEEVQLLRKKFPDCVENHIEKLMPSLFMPRNEEEVMKNILLLSRQLRYVKDIPQGFISFEEQTDSELTFTVILLRILFYPSTSSILQLFSPISPGFSFCEDRVKNVGFLRDKYPKEATVFRLRVPKIYYKRKDHSVDLLKARQDVVKEIKERVGDFRDYNGGMISNQIENFYALRKLFLQDLDDLELENFFHLIFPVEMRSVVDPSLLKLFYDLWKKVKDSKKEVFYGEELKGCLIFMVSFLDVEIGRKITAFIRQLELKSSQALTISLKDGKNHFLGYILQGLSDQDKEEIRRTLFL